MKSISIPKELNWDDDIIPELRRDNEERGRLLKIAARAEETLKEITRAMRQMNHE